MGSMRAGIIPARPRFIPVGKVLFCQAQKLTLLCFIKQKHHLKKHSNENTCHTSHPWFPFYCIMQ